MSALEHDPWDDAESELPPLPPLPSLPEPGTPERERFDAKQNAMVTGLLRAARMRPPLCPSRPGAGCFCSQCGGEGWRQAGDGWRCAQCSPMTAHDIPLVIAWFPTAFPKGPAYGDQQLTTWGNFARGLLRRREGDKDGPNFVPARFNLEADGRHVRRLGANLAARTAVALDVETNKVTGEIPLRFNQTVERIRNRGWAAVVYTSHSHRPEAPRYRIVVPLTEEIDHELPAPEIVADQLGVAGVLDRSKITPASLFYLPSTASEELDHHETVTIDGDAIDAAWMRQTAGALLAQRQAEQDRIAALARAEAAARREAKIAAGFDPDDSLIEKLRSRFDLAGVLLSHDYSHRKGKYRHPNSESGSYGADIKILGGIERVFSHNATDPLHAENLPDWCGGVTALDVIDVVTILDFGGNRTKALAELAQRFGLTKAEERKKLAALLFRLIRKQATQEQIESAAFAEGGRLGLSRAEVRRVAAWVADQAITREAA